jgi:hypothetical protein
MSQNEIDAATMARVEEFNAQQQSKMTWPDNSAVARAYVDQLTRSHGIQPDRARAVRSALEKVDGLRSGQDKNASAALEQVDALAKQIDADAGTASGRDAARLKALASTLRGRAAKLR